MNVTKETELDLHLSTLELLVGKVRQLPVDDVPVMLDLAVSEIRVLLDLWPDYAEHLVALQKAAQKNASLKELKGDESVEAFDPEST